MNHKPNEWAAVITCIHFEQMPLVQVAQAILENPEDKTKIHMIYANVTYDDIVLKVLMIIFALFSFH
jgi:NAD(P)H-flavin reductase